MKQSRSVFCAVLLIIGFTVLIASCHKHSDTPSSNKSSGDTTTTTTTDTTSSVFIVSSLTTTTSSETMKDSFQVDSYKRLTTWTHIQTPTGGSPTTTPITFTYNTSSDSIPASFSVEGQTVNFIFDASGRITGTTVSVFGVTDTLNLITYSGNSIVVKTPLSATDHTDYTVDSMTVTNGDLSSYKVDSVISGVITSRQGVDFGFSSNTNPFHYKPLPQSFAIYLFAFSYATFQNYFDALSTNALSSLTISASTPIVENLTQTLDAKNRVITNTFVSSNTAVAASFTLTYNYY